MEVLIQLELSFLQLLIHPIMGIWVGKGTLMLRTGIYSYEVYNLHPLNEHL